MRFAHHAAVALLAVIAGACSQTPPETRLIDDAAAALGGVDRINAAKTLVVEGDGIAGGFGQGMMPDDPTLLNWTVTEYNRSADLSDGRWIMRQLRTPTFPGPPPYQRLVQGLDGDIAYNVVGSPGEPQDIAVRASAIVARDRRVEALHHPLGALRAALDPTAKVANYRDEGTLQSVDITTAKGDVITLAVDRGTHLPAYIRSTAYNVFLGDMVIQSAFADYAGAGGLMLPTRITTSHDKHIVLELNVRTNAVDTDVGDLAAQTEVASAEAPPTLPVYDIKPQQVAKGIWLLPGTHNSVVFEFADHLTLLEVPLNESRAQAVIAAARALVPAKPLTDVIITHHHTDHSAGLRTAVAENLTIIADRNMEAFINDMVNRPHTIEPDALAKHPVAAKIELVQDQKLLKDGAMEVRLFHVNNLAHAGTMLIAFVPSEGLLINADLYGSEFTAFPAWDALLANVAERQLKIEKHLPIHGRLQTAGEAAATVAAKTAKPAA